MDIISPFNLVLIAFGAGGLVSTVGYILTSVINFKAQLTALIETQKKRDEDQYRRELKRAEYEVQTTTKLNHLEAVQMEILQLLSKKNENTIK